MATDYSPVQYPPVGELFLVDCTSAGALRNFRRSNVIVAKRSACYDPLLEYHSGPHYSLFKKNRNAALSL
jgi:hypothetical protein